MKKVAILKFLGDFASEFHITLDISNEGEPPHSTVTGRLPGDTAIIASSQKWSRIYQSRCKSGRIYLGSSRNVNIGALNQDLYHKSNDLRCQFNAWLKLDGFNRVTESLKKLNPSDEIRFIISSDCQELRKLPWHLWDLLAKYSQAEVALRNVD